MGLQAADTEYVITLDSEDYVDPDFLKNMLEQLERENLDVLFPTMNIISKGRIILKIPRNDSFCNRVFSPLETISLTLGNWDISFNECLAKKSVWQETYRRYGEGRTDFLLYDEILFRQMLLCAERIGISPEPYYYVVDNLDSVTRKKGNIRQFHYMHNNALLLDMARDMYGLESGEYRRMQYRNFFGIIHAYRLWGLNKFNHADREEAIRIINHNRSLIDFTILKGNVPLYKYVILKNKWLPAREIFPLLHHLSKLRPQKHK